MNILLDAARKMNSPVAANRAMTIINLKHRDKTTLAGKLKEYARADETDELP